MSIKIRAMVAAVATGMTCGVASGVIFSVNGMDDTISTIDPDTGAVINTFSTPIPAQNDGGSGLAFSGKSLYFADINNFTVFELDPVTGAVTNSFIGPNAQMDALGFGTSSFGPTLFSLQFAMGNARIHLINPDTGDVWTSVDTNRTLVGGMDFNPATGTLFVGEFGFDDMIFEIDPETGQMLNHFPATDGATGIGFDGPRMFVSDRDVDMIFEFDPSNGDILNNFPSPDGSPGALAGGTIPEPAAAVLLSVLTLAALPRRR